MGNKALFMVALLGLLIIIPFSYAETLSCYIKDPGGTNVATGSRAITGCSTSNVQCSAACPVTTSACCNIEGQYTWQVYDNPPSFTCGGGSYVNPAAASKTGNAYSVNWSTQTYCLQTCAGSPVFWDSSLSQCCGVDFNDPDMSSASCLNCPLGLNQGSREWDIGGIPNCCGDDSQEYIRDCQDNDEGFCAQASDNHACCDGLADCVYNDNCYAWQEQTGEWKCGELELGIWHDVVAPWAEIRINNGNPYTITRDVTLNLNLSDNGSGVSEYLIENDEGYFEWYNYSEEESSTADSGGPVASYNFDSIQSGGQVPDQSGNDNNGSLYGNTRLLMHLDEGSGNPQDSSSYGNDGTISGAAWSSDCQSGSCLVFDGLNDYVNASNDASLNIIDEITIEAWANWSGAGTIFQRIVDKGVSYEMYLHPTTQEFQIWLYTSGVDLNGWVVGTALIDEWAHYVFTFDGSVARGYINGVEENSITLGSVSIIPDVIRSLLIGDRTSGGRAFSGTIDEVAIYSRALTEEEIIEHNNTGRAKFIENVPGKFGDALEFDGVDDYVTVADNGDILDITTGEQMSISVWINFSSGRTRNTILGKGTNIGDLFLGEDNIEAGKVEGCSGIGLCATSDNALNDDIWHHIVYVIDDVSDEQALWVDGVKQDDIATVTPPSDNSEPLLIGYGPAGQLAEYWNGTIDEVRIYDRALTPEEIGELYSSSGPGGEGLTKNWTLSQGDGVKTVYLSAKDKAGNSRKVSDTIILDTSDPITWIDPPLPEWIGPEHEKWEGNENGSVKAFNVSWKAQDVSGIDCYQVQYNTSAISWTNWTIEGTNCTNRTEWALGPAEPIQLQDGETYSFRARALDNVGRLGAWSPENHTRLDTGKPELDVNIEMGGVVLVEGYESDGYGGSRLRFSGSREISGKIISYQSPSDVKLNSSAWDSTSGIRSHYIRYCVIYEGVEDCRRYNCPQTFLPGEISYCELSIPYGENMVIKFRVVAEDYAGNKAGFPGIGENTNFYITDHPLANFFVHQLDMLIGDSALLKVYVRNMQDRFDNVTVSLSGYDFASFADAGDGDLSFDKRTLWIGLNPYEEKEFFVKVFSSSIGRFFVYLNASSTLTKDGELCLGTDCVKDSDTASISTGYPLEFPGINIWGILLIVMISLVVYSRVGIKGLNH